MSNNISGWFVEWDCVDWIRQEIWRCSERERAREKEVRERERKEKPEPYHFFSWADVFLDLSQTFIWNLCDFYRHRYQKPVSCIIIKSGLVLSLSLCMQCWCENVPLYDVVIQNTLCRSCALYFSFRCVPMLRQFVFYVDVYSLHPILWRLSIDNNDVLFIVYSFRWIWITITRTRTITNLWPEIGHIHT